MKTWIMKWLLIFWLVPKFTKAWCVFWAAFYKAVLNHLEKATAKTRVERTIREARAAAARSA